MDRNRWRMLIKRKIERKEKIRREEKCYLTNNGNQ